MALLKSYSCVKCGGVLNFDENQEVFGCPFCGGEFAFTDFHRGDLIRQGNISLNRGNYSTAKDKFLAILNRNPRDFEALQGMILAEGRITAVNRLCRIEYLEDSDLKAAIHAANKAGEALPEENEYFGLLVRMFEIARDYLESGAEANEASEKQNMHFRNMSYQIMRVEEAEEATFDGYKKAIGFLATRCLPVIFAVSLVFQLWWITIAFVLVVAIVGICLKIHYASAKKNIEKSLDDKMKTQFKIDDAAVAKMKETRHEYMNTYIKLKKIVPDPKAYEKPLPQPKYDNSVVNDPFIDIEKTVICNKCGGLLTLDKEKNLYECRSCGVAYGASLFFGNPLEKAKKAIEENDFAEADQRFSHMLMTDPNSFEALLGRVLCAGKWKTVSDIALTDLAVSDVRLKNILERADDAVSHVSEEDKPVLEDIRKLAVFYIDYVKATQAASVFSSKLEYISKNRITFLKNNDDSELKNQSDYIKWRKEELLKKHNAKTGFDELKAKVVTDYRNRTFVR